MRILLYFVTAALFLACAGAPLKYEKAEQLTKNEEFEKAIKIEKPPESVEPEPGTSPTPSISPTPSPTPTPTPAPTPVAKKEKPAKKAKKDKKEKATEVPAGPTRRQPELEDDQGFEGRRPLKDPFRVGEEVVHSMRYFKVSAGELHMKVGPMATVNGRKAYNFNMSIKSSSVFSSFYSVDDKVETFVDYETLVPRVFSLHVKETSQLREARMIFDEATNKATFWEKKVTKEHGEEEKKQNWDILPFSQNVYSAIYYIRNFQWDVGKEVAFRVADDNENLIFKAKCLRKEKIDTDIGEMNAVVLKPEIILKGAFKPVGDIYIWLSDDDRHYVLRIESKIKIGTIVSEVTSIKPGQN